MCAAARYLGDLAPATQPITSLKGEHFHKANAGGGGHAHGVAAAAQTDAAPSKSGAGALMKPAYVLVLHAFSVSVVRMFAPNVYVGLQYPATSFLRPLYCTLFSNRACFGIGRVFCEAHGPPKSFFGIDCFHVRTIIPFARRCRPSAMTPVYLLAFHVFFIAVVKTLAKFAPVALGVAATAAFFVLRNRK